MSVGFVPWIIAIVILLGCILRNCLLHQLPNRESLWVIWGTLILSAIAFSVVSYSASSLVGLRHSLYLMRQLSQAEICSAPKENEKSSRGMLVFEKWARYVNETQKSDLKTPRARRIFSKISGEECELRFPDEPWLHYRWRRFVRTIASWNRERQNASESISSFNLLSSRLNLKWIEIKERWQSPHFYPHFYYLWLEYPEPEFYNSFRERVQKKGLNPLSEFIQKLKNGEPQDTSISHSLALVTHSLYLAPIVGTPTLRSALPTELWNTLSETCEGILTHPESTPETQEIFDYLKYHLNACETRKQIIAEAKMRDCNTPLKLPEDCKPEHIQHSIRLSCVLRAKNSDRFLREQKAIHWPGISQDLALSLHVLHMPEKYFNSVTTSRYPYQLLRFSYELAKLLDPKFFFHSPVAEAHTDNADAESWSQWTSGSDLPLTRLGAISLFSPFSMKEPPINIQNKLEWYNFRSEVASLLQQFRQAHLKTANLEDQR